jgi:pimeloyl-ACP methyl ester carboxylesterase
MNLELRSRGLALLHALDLADELGRVTSPTLVCVGELDPITPVAAAKEIVESLSDGLGRLAVIEGAGHFPWLDDPEAYWEVITGFIGHVRASRPDRAI